MLRKAGRVDDVDYQTKWAAMLIHRLGMEDFTEA